MRIADPSSAQAVNVIEGTALAATVNRRRLVILIRGGHPIIYYNFPLSYSLTIYAKDLSFSQP
jgi:hypothetical protein